MYLSYRSNESQIGRNYFTEAILKRKEGVQVNVPFNYWVIPSTVLNTQTI